MILLTLLSTWRYDTSYIIANMTAWYFWHHDTSYIIANMTLL